MVAPAINSIIYSVGAIHESPVFILYLLQIRIECKVFARIDICNIGVALQNNIVKFVAADGNVFKSFGTDVILLTPLIVASNRRLSPLNTRLKIVKGYGFGGLSSSSGVVRLINFLLMNTTEFFNANRNLATLKTIVNHQSNASVFLV